MLAKHKCAFYKLSSVAVSTAMLPVGQKQVSACVHLTKVDYPDPNTVIAVCSPLNAKRFAGGDEGALYRGGVAGYVCVEKCDEEREEVTLTVPVKGELPSYMFLVGDDEDAFGKIAINAQQQ